MGGTDVGADYLPQRGVGDGDERVLRGGSVLGATMGGEEIGSLRFDDGLPSEAGEGTRARPSAHGKRIAWWREG